MKLNTDGGLIWQRFFGGTLVDIIYSVGSTGDGGAIISGSTTSANNGNFVGLNNNGNQDCWIIKVNDNGNTY